MSLLVMIRVQVRVHEVLRDKPGQVVRRKIGKNTACRRSQIG